MDSTEHISEPALTRWTPSTVYPDMWIDPDDDPRETDVETVDERDILLEYLRYYRLTIEMKCADLNAEQLARRSVPPSTMSLLGLVRHLAEGERHFRRVMAGEDAPKLYCTDEDRDGDWNGAIADPAVVDDAWRQWRAEMQLADQFVASVADLGTRNAGVSDLGPNGVADSAEGRPASLLQSARRSPESRRATREPALAPPCDTGHRTVFASGHRCGSLRRCHAVRRTRRLPSMEGLQG
jgi:hypothetical protein